PAPPETWFRQPAWALPSTLTALPHTVTGAFTAGLIWFPEPTPWSPPVELPPPALAPAETWFRQPALALPSALTALPHTVTGADTAGFTWFPDSTPYFPLVELLPPLAGPETWFRQPAFALPSTPTALPHTVTGADTAGFTSFPASAPR